MATTESPPDLARLFCDLVMKGGITSGVVYPSAVAGLSTRYRLRNIGGASAGAIAAAAAAAAEHGRQKHGTNAGFVRLDGLARELARPVDSDPERRSRLFHLFAPTQLSQPLFSVLAEMLNRRTVSRRIGIGIAALVRAFPGTLVLGLAAAVLIAAPIVAALAPWFHAMLALRNGRLAAALLVLGTAPAFLAIAAAVAAVVLGLTIRRALRHLALVMARQDFGLCTGRRESGEGPPALTDWLHELIQDVAGERGGAPLTFGDLRRVRFAETPGADGVVLRMITTCLTLGRPYTLPIRERLYFDPVELGRYFPKDVVDWMVKQSWRVREGEEREDRDADALAAKHTVDGDPRPLLPIPEPDDFPVVVAARMSLSFPILLSAIPLHRFAVRDEDGTWVPYLQRLVFTDGGVCSNLPIHLFDSPIPQWPTFALNLRDDLPAKGSEKDRVVAPDGGRRHEGDRYEISSDATLGAIGSYLLAIGKTMQNWRDMLQRVAPGAKERVFTVRHRKDEGGLNLDMDQAAIDAMARSGARAADAIAAAFLAPPGTPPAADEWQHHRWVRLRLLLPVVRTFLRRLGSAACASGETPSVEELLTDVPRPMGRSHELNRASGTAAWTLLSDLTAASSQLEASQPPHDLERTQPRPPGELRVTPTF